jgi:hypothetical protein
VKISLVQAAAITDLHEVVEYLCDKLASEALKSMNSNLDQSIQTSVPVEKSRIYRTLYRLQLNLPKAVSQMTKPLNLGGFRFQEYGYRLGSLHLHFALTILMFQLLQGS